jgi:hypothetical protein
MLIFVHVIPANHKRCSLIKVDWLAAYIALRVVGAVLVDILWRWRKICTILQPMGARADT